MNKSLNYLLSVALLLALSISACGLQSVPAVAERPAVWAVPIASEHLENLYRVDDRIYRSEQPGRAAMAELRRLGIVRVLNLRDEHDDEDEASGTGLQLFRVQMNAGSITEEELVEALRIVRSSPEPILIHCRHGADRTGAVVAMYRILFQGWSKQEAIEEMVYGGYGFHPIFQNIIATIEGADIGALRQRLDAHPPEQTEKSSAWREHQVSFLQFTLPVAGCGSSGRPVGC